MDTSPDKILILFFHTDILVLDPKIRVLMIPLKMKAHCSLGMWHKFLFLLSKFSIWKAFASQTATANGRTKSI